jgi:hypothetical protein
MWLQDKKDRVDEFSPTNDISDGTADGDLRYGRESAHPESRMPVARLFANPGSDPGRSGCLPSGGIIPMRAMPGKSAAGLRIALVSSMPVSVTYAVIIPKPTIPR